jgi:hypothetical protein
MTSDFNRTTRLHIIRVSWAVFVVMPFLWKLNAKLLC